MQKYEMKILAASLTLLIALAVCAHGQAQPDSTKQAAMAKLEKVSTELQLTPAQKQQIAPILMAEAPKMQALKSDTTMPKMQKAMKMRQIAESTDAQMKPILTPDQYLKWEGIREQERQQMMQKMQQQQ